MTLRARLVAILAALVSLGLLVSGVVTYGALKSFLYERVDAQLRDVQPAAVRALIVSARGHLGFSDPREGPPRLPISAYAELRGPAGDVIQRVAFGLEDEPTYQPAIGDSIDASDDEPFTVEAVDAPSYKFRALATPTLQGGTLVVAIPLADAQDTLRRLLVIEVVVAALLLGAIALAAWLLIRKELGPLDRMAEAATEIAGGDLSRRVEQLHPRTEVGRLGRALNKMLEHIEQAFLARRASEERMRRFLADASHELRTPLTSIRGYAELFRRGASSRPEDLRVSMRRIEDEAARMGVLVDELLLLAHMDQTRPLQFSRVDLSAIVVDAGKDARARDPDRPIEVDAMDAVTVRGDGDRLRQAVSNLVTNALVHTPPGTPIALRLEEDGEFAVVTVVDSGPGLDPDALEHAFDRFWRGDPSRSRHTGGAGLGLAIVDAIARAHGGEITAENVPTGGARFTLRLPLIDSQSFTSPDSASSEVETAD